MSTNLKKAGFVTYAIVRALFAPFMFMAISILVIPVAIQQRDLKGYLQRRFAVESLLRWAIGGLGYYYTLLTIVKRIDSFGDDTLFEFQARFNEGYTMFVEQFTDILENQGFDLYSMSQGWKYASTHSATVNDLFDDCMRDVGIKIK